MPPKMPTFRVVRDDGTAYRTSMAVGTTLDQARAYFLGAPQIDEDPETGKETHRRVVAVEEASHATDAQVALAASIVDELYSGLRMHGTYTFFDKGPVETIDLTAILDRLKAAGADDAFSALGLIRDVPEYGMRLVSAILVELQDWAELWAAHEDALSEWDW